MSSLSLNLEDIKAPEKFESKDNKGDPTKGMTDDEKIEYYLANSN